MDAIFGGPSQFAPSSDHVDFILLHQELQAFGVLVHDSLFALLDRAPVQRDAGRVLEPEFYAFLHVVKDFRVEQ